jgi:IS30 family transposase
MISTRRSIGECPAIVETRARIGNWEADTLICKSHRHAIVSLVDRKTRFTLIGKVDRKTSQQVSQAIVDPYKDQVRTLTSDNGREFAGCRLTPASRIPMVPESAV